jgi:hypothetical protein
MFSALSDSARGGFRTACNRNGTAIGTHAPNVSQARLHPFVPAVFRWQQILNPIGMRGASHRKQQTSENMKPTILTTCNASRRDSFDPAMCSHRVSPIANYHYHSVTFESFRANCGRTSVRSFWNITGDYLKSEARHDFLGEAALFAVVVITAFLPLISNAHALMEFVRAMGNY